MPPEDELLKIGQFIFLFSQAEFNLRMVFSILLGNVYDLGEVFSDIFSAFEVPKLFEVLIRNFPTRLSTEEIEKLKSYQKDFLKINDFRVNLVHGFITLGSGGVELKKPANKRKLEEAWVENFSSQLGEMIKRLDDFSQTVILMESMKK
jgi:hypothetical protein